MVRVVYVEKSAANYVDTLASGGDDREIADGVVGLVIGQYGEHGDFYVVHLVRTPLIEESSTADHGSIDAGDVESVPATIKPSSVSKKKSNKPVNAASSLSTKKWDVDLVVQHAQQVTRMLLGGFDVLGVFASTLSEQLSADKMIACRQVLSEIHKTQTNSPVPSKISSTERLFVHISCSSNKVSYKAVDVLSTLASPKTVDHKVASTRWIRLQCRLAINETIHLTKEQSGLNLAKQIRVGLNPLRVAFEDSIYVIEGQMRNEKDPLMDTGGGRGNKKANSPERPSCLNVDFLLNTNAAKAKPCLALKECNVAMQVRGTIQGRTHVPSKTTVADAIKSLKLDVLRSLIGRCEIHCEDLLVIDEEQLDRVLVHELPCRIFAQLTPDGDITVSDFLFPGEHANDSLDALAELLDITPSADNIEVGCERPSESSDRTPSPSFEHDTGIPVEEMLPPKALLKSCNYIFLGLSVAVALVACATSFYLLQR